MASQPEQEQSSKDRLIKLIVRKQVHRGADLLQVTLLCTAKDKALKMVRFVSYFAGALIAALAGWSAADMICKSGPYTSRAGTLHITQCSISPNL